MTASPDIGRFALIVGAASLSGVINSIAGGGTLLTFPALIGLGVPPLVANATSTVALWPGSVASVWGYRRLLSGMQDRVSRFALPSLGGGLVGALLLLATPAARFERIVPWLVLGATVMFVIQRPLSERLRLRTARAERATRIDDDSGDASVKLPPSLLAFQFAVAIYGGYFGAGIGIIMLAALGFMGFRNIHRMNGLKNWGGLCANAVAALMFAFTGLVDWPVAIAMAIGATIGGYGGSRLAQRIPQVWVRRAIIGAGLASTVWLIQRA